MFAIPRMRFAYVSVLLSACVAYDDGTNSDIANPRPADSPDVVIFSVSGHCGPETCLGSEWNGEYLYESGTVDAFADPLRERGLRVANVAAIDDWFTWVDDNDEVLAMGFLGLLDALYMVNEDWIADYDNPTRVIMVAHSHGDVWAHIAVHVADDVPIDVLVDFDGVSVGWEAPVAGVGDNWQEVILSESAEHGLEWPFEIWEATDYWQVPGHAGLHDIEDLVPDNVDLNLAIVATPTPAQAAAGIWDSESNLRLDGTTRRIKECQSVENHSHVYRPGKDCMEWAVNEVLARFD